MTTVGRSRPRRCASILPHRRGHGSVPGAMLHAEPAEQHDLNWLANAANELFDAAPVPGGRPVKRGAALRRDAAVHHPPGKPVDPAGPALPPPAPPRGSASGGSAARMPWWRMPAPILSKPGTGVESGRGLRGPGCTRPQLQQAFRARLAARPWRNFRHAHRVCGPAAGTRASPGEVAAQMGYCSGAYFSQNSAQPQATPSAYRRIQQAAR